MSELSPQFDSLESIDDIKALISGGIAESDVLEYKTAKEQFSDKDKTEISKDISAMANASGGIIIYGVKTKERGKNKTLPDKITYINPTNAEILDQVINSQIRPPISGIRKKFIGKKKTHQIMVVHIPQSVESPHQNLADKRYYRRSLSESLPMEHDLIALHFGKRSEPVLQLIVSYATEKKPELIFDEENFSQELEFLVSLLNTGKTVAKYTKVIISFPNTADIKLLNTGSLVDIGDLYPGRKEKVYQYSYNNDVVHPDLKLRITNIKLKVSKNFITKQMEDRIVLNWKIFADGMVKKEGKNYLK